MIPADTNHLAAIPNRQHGEAESFYVDDNGAGFSWAVGAGVSPCLNRPRVAVSAKKARGKVARGLEKRARLANAHDATNEGADCSAPFDKGADKVSAPLRLLTCGAPGAPLSYLPTACRTTFRIWMKSRVDATSPSSATRDNTSISALVMLWMRRS